MRRPTQLTSSDYRHALWNLSCVQRKTLSEVGSSMHISTNTARKHLETMGMSSRHPLLKYVPCMRYDYLSNLDTRELLIEYIKCLRNESIIAGMPLGYSYLVKCQSTINLLWSTNNIDSLYIIDNDMIGNVYDLERIAWIRHYTRTVAYNFESTSPDSELAYKFHLRYNS